jgi:dTDP-4-dehydrorhamnose 3,5-epimerase
MEILRCDDDLYSKSGQVCMATAYPGAMNAWHYHKLQSDNIAVVHGTVPIALYDARRDSPTHGEVNVFHVGVHNPMLVRVPALVCDGFKNVGLEEAIIVNTVSEVYRYNEPDEYRIDPHDSDIPSDWELRDG